jgi:SAM-dependent methyltransferase
MGEVIKLILPFLSTTKNYAEVLTKLASFAWYETYFITLLLRSNWRVDSLFTTIETWGPIGRAIRIIPHYDVVNPVGILIAFFVAVLTHAFQFHDRISDVLGIRRRFDCRSILVPLAQRVGVVVTKDKEVKIAENRDELMRAVFYKYASSRDEEALVDKHDIEHALTAWSWFWVPVEAIFYFGVGAIIAWSVNSRDIALIFVAVSVAGLVFAFAQALALPVMRDHKSMQSQPIRRLPMPSRPNSMRYKLKSGVEIRTENAAKPETQQSKFLLDLISNLPHVAWAFDYGCGKLRYQRAIAATADVLALVDSEIQLSRVQVLRGKQTSIRSIFRESNRTQVYSDIEFQALDAKFERSFCINVLSVIPSYVRRREVLSTVRRKLRGDGECLFVVQYRNSDFDRMKKMSNAIPRLDGFLIDSLRGHSFYGMIAPARLEASLRRAGFEIRETRLNEGRAYTWATANSPN